MTTLINPIDIALAVHAICEERLIPKGISPNHTMDVHGFTTGFYADRLNKAGVQASGEEIAAAIIKAADWDMESPWPGHPSPDKVIAQL